MRTAFGELLDGYIEKYRKFSGLSSLRDVAKATGTNVNAISTSISGKSPPPPDSVVKWANAFQGAALMDDKERLHFIAMADRARPKANEALQQAHAQISMMRPATNRGRAAEALLREMVSLYFRGTGYESARPMVEGRLEQILAQAESSGQVDAAAVLSDVFAAHPVLQLRK